MGGKFPPQHQQPRREHEVTPRPEVILSDCRGSGKLRDKMAAIMCGAIDVGPAVALHFTRNSARVVVGCREETKGAEETCALVEAKGQPCCLFRGTLGEVSPCTSLAGEAVEAFGRIDVLVNNGAEQHATDTLKEITPEPWDRTFLTNIYACFYPRRAPLPHMEGSSIINTTSVNAYKGKQKLIAYATMKGTVVAFTRSIALTSVERGIRVNGVAPGSVWTPLIRAAFPEDDVAKFGCQVPMNRAGQPSEIAPSHIFLASGDASSITG